MTRYQQALEGMLYDLLSEQRFSLRNLEMLMKESFPGRYSLAFDNYDHQDIGRIRILFDDQYEKTEWMMRWG